MGEVVQALCTGFYCTGCGAFNGDSKEFRKACRCCDAPRPRVNMTDGEKLEAIRLLVNTETACRYSTYGLIRDIKEILAR